MQIWINVPRPISLFPLQLRSDETIGHPITMEQDAHNVHICIQAYSLVHF